VALKLAGRFVPTPDFSLAEPEFEELLQANRFPSRETIKAGAESLLKLYNLDRQD